MAGDHIARRTAVICAEVLPLAGLRVTSSVMTPVAFVGRRDLVISAADGRAFFWPMRASS
jgi:hypothetical protein